MKEIAEPYCYKLVVFYANDVTDDDLVPANLDQLASPDDPGQTIVDQTVTLMSLLGKQETRLLGNRR